MGLDISNVETPSSFPVPMSVFRGVQASDAGQSPDVLLDGALGEQFIVGFGVDERFVGLLSQAFPCPVLLFGEIEVDVEQTRSLDAPSARWHGDNGHVGKVLLPGTSPLADGLDPLRDIFVATVERV
ncbi:hypothetical protein AB0H00_25980 [Nocardia sp. NPDC023852]|uniref:hypothetical protein n=1 Tax=Nocardia sp. NPDC023852 TaxID=3154697 RepID=UPI00340A607C